MSVRDANRRRRWRPCLKCGRMMHTDRCHRICKRCNEENQYVGRFRLLRQLDSVHKHVGDDIADPDDRLDLWQWAATHRSEA